eukprot:CAMPEP_0115361574 /NCGR_PEP_ID=MMETSP0270-20121206/102270_1 /TAXON_ID=71861 /ORGANISM="Scrippsiella trochoidea, Strain CCMP3099" /LENGTH=61 /DNA_ID=CAMNT_0002784139 /DNA_START=321 /DNA_END=507 /DNA_ORIENTATION=-
MTKRITAAGETWGAIPAQADPCLVLDREHQDVEEHMVNARAKTCHAVDDDTPNEVRQGLNR